MKADLGLLETPTDLFGVGLSLCIQCDGEGSWGVGTNLPPHPAPISLMSVSLCH